LSDRTALVAVFASGLDHPEGLAVHPDGTIWAGGEDGQIYIVSPQGRVVEHARTGGFSAGMAFDRSGACFVCNVPGRIVRVEANGQFDTFATEAAGVPLRAPNYPVFGPDGMLYVSDSGDFGAANGTIVRFSPDGTGERFHDGPFQYPNGLAIDSAGAYLYAIETGLHSLVRLELAGAGDAVPEVICPPGSLEWMPDGMAFDAVGSLYVTMYASDRIYRVDAGLNPTILAEDRMALSLNRPTNCAFGGPGFDQLFVANLGGRHLSVIDLGRSGQRLYGGPR